MEMTSRVEVEEDSDNNKGSMWDLDQKLDQPMDEEAGRLRNTYREKKFSQLLLLRLAFQSLGVVYGDLGTSPLYVFYNTFPHGIKDPEDVIGALSLIIYSLTLIPLLKYVFVVCRANDNGQGGTFALYSLLCRHANVRTIPNQHRTDEELTTYSRSTFHEQSFAAKTKRWLERYAFRRNALLILVLVGTCMVIGDGILTPAISDVVTVVAVVILVGLFSMQHYGTDKVGWLFAPIVLLWFLLIGGIGLFNIWKYDTGVLKAFSPVYIYKYLRKGGKDGWTSLGGIMLSITGIEALFADLAHFPVAAIQIAFTVVVFPCLLLAYSGQAAYLMQNREHVVDAFYRSIPGKNSLTVEYPRQTSIVASFFWTAVVIVMLKNLFDSLFLFVRLESMMEGCSDSDEYSLYGQQTERSREALLDNNGNRTPSLADPTISSIDSIVQFKSPSEANLTVRLSGQRSSQTEVDDREFLNNCRDAGVVHIMGNTVVRARRDSRFYKKIAVDYIYAFLRKICRENSMILNVPHESLLNVGQIFYV
ncbi:hypothetical protein SADUNF_Sadunf01G0099500 [Salix dunnii]|uniref:K+ potassium transporter integral membrane domain-containing protein n=1 Tax=Salix dunnii TaxID=1413687 RepID=A0A835NB24_9ROSI|nr:hypothetical protein SADUNF_Sadunf01G0099500 [Salix dunnii]